MRLAILMSIGSPWARQIAMSLSSVGESVHVVDFARPLAHDSYLSTLHSFQTAAIAELHQTVAAVHLINSRSASAFRYFSSALPLRRMLNAIGADLLLTLYGGGHATMAWLCGFRPFVVYAMGSDVLMASGLRRHLARASMSAANLVLANGEYLAKRTSEMAPSAKVLPLYHGIDVERFVPRRRSSPLTHVICSRGFTPVYNNEYLIRALALLPDDRRDLAVTFAAGGSLLEQARVLADRILSPRLRSNVRFLGGIDQELLRGLLGESDIFISLSRSDGTSTSLLEALACGLFPVLSDIPANREWVSSDKANGILVPLDEPEQLARAIAAAVANAQWRRSASDSNRQIVVNRANIRKQMATLANWLNEVALRGAKGDRLAPAGTR